MYNLEIVGLGYEIALAVRNLRKVPAYALLAIALLALAIGANTAIFSLIDAVLLKPLPAISQPERLVSLYHQSVRGADLLSSSSWPDYEYYRDQNHVFSSLAAYLRLPMLMRAGDRADSVSGELVSANYFQLLGVSAQLGRTFAADDGRAPGESPVVVLSDRLWRERFQASPAAIGKTIFIGGHPFTVIGVARPEFRGVVLDWGERPDLWIPINMYREAVPALGRFDLLHNWGGHTLLVTGRLRDGVSLAQAEAEMRALSGRIDVDHPDRARIWKEDGLAWTVRTLPLAQARFWPGFRNQIVKVTAVLIAVVAGVLLIACSNMASLMLTRAAQRRKEIAARLALGAGPYRIARLLLVESLLIAAAGGAAGLLVAALSVRALSSFPRLFVIPLALDLTIDVRALGFTALVTTLCGVVFGLAPLRYALRTDLISALRAGTAASRSRGETTRSREALLAAQVGLTLVLLVGAGLFLRTFQNAARSEPFLHAGNLLLVGVDTATGGMDIKHAGAFFSDLLDRVRDLPGVRSAGFAWVLPLSGMRGARDIAILEPTGETGPRRVNVDMNVVSPGYFKTVGPPILRGRDFNRSDRQGSPAVAIVNQQMAQQFWRGDAVGRQIRRGESNVTIVGIVGDDSRGNYRKAIPSRFYAPVAQESMTELNLVVRAQGNPVAVLPSVREAIALLSREAVIGHPMTLSSYANTALAQERLAAWCLGALAILALVLSSVGLYGAVAYSVSQRTAEIGVRVALGAKRGDVIRMVVGRVGKTVTVGVASGWLASFLLGRYAKALLFGVAETDPLTWIAGSVVLCLAALAASAGPARRAARIDPARALRSE